MKTTLKKFLSRPADEEDWEDLFHHIAEEELISCKVFRSVKVGEGKNMYIKVIADCNDKKRKPGYQEDLTEKLNKRLKKHYFPGLGYITAKVYHDDIDPR